MLCFCCETKSQNYFYTTSGGIITRSSSENCETDTINSIGAIDIAIVPNGKLYLNSGGILYRVDYEKRQCDSIGQMQTLSGYMINGTGLVGLNNDYLLMDMNDSLYKVNVHTAIGTLIDKIGFGCDGDFAFFQDTLYMVGGSHLIKIILNPTKTSIINVIDVGYLGNTVSLFTSLDCTNNEYALCMVVDNNVYTINTNNASSVYKCSLPNYIGAAGACSLNDFQLDSSIFPNVFTPNDDGVNDLFKLSVCSVLNFSIYNRWGNLVYQTDDIALGWNGKTKQEKDCPSGVYYYLVTTKDKTYKGFVQLIR